MKGRNNGLSLTYAAPDPGDGAGAQVQRILGIFGAAATLGLGYVHTGIRDLGANPGDSFRDSRDRTSYVRTLNSLVTFPSVEGFSLAIRITRRRLPYRIWRRLPVVHRLLSLFRMRVLLAIENPYDFVDAVPNAYLAGSREVRDRLSDVPRSCETLRVDVHIRRTVTPAHDLSGNPYERHLATSWYLAVLGVVAQVARRSHRKLRIRIHTDADPGSDPWTVPADLQPATRAMWHSAGVLDAAGDTISYHTEDFGSLFQPFGEVEVLCGVDPISAWRSMVSSDVLVTYPSSFSFVGGLLKADQTVISPHFWHATPDLWLTLPRNLDLDEDAYAESGQAIFRYLERKWI